MKKSQLIGSLIFNTILVLVISKLATDSLNPFEVFHGDKLWLKLLIGFIMVTMAFGLLGLLVTRSLQDQDCAGCSKSLLAFQGAFGNPLKCMYCGRWFHTNCFKSKGGSAMEGCKHPGCPSAVESV